MLVLQKLSYMKYWKNNGFNNRYNSFQVYIEYLSPRKTKKTTLKVQQHSISRQILTHPLLQHYPVVKKLLAKIESWQANCIVARLGENLAPPKKDQTQSQGIFTCKKWDGSQCSVDSRVAGPSEPGEQRSPHILADKLTIFQSGRTYHTPNPSKRLQKSPNL